MSKRSTKRNIESSSKQGLTGSESETKRQCSSQVGMSRTFLQLVQIIDVDKKSKHNGPDDRDLGQGVKACKLSEDILPFVYRYKCFESMKKSPFPTDGFLRFMGMAHHSLFGFSRSLPIAGLFQHILDNQKPCGVNDRVMQSLCTMHGKDITLQHVLRAVYCIDLLWTLYPAKSLLEVLSHCMGSKALHCLSLRYKTLF